MSSSLNKKNKKYELLEHRADLKIKAYGKNLVQVFSHLLLGMFESCQPEILKESVSRKISIEARDQESLLVNFLSEALFLAEINREVYLKVKFAQIGDNRLVAELKGYKIKSLRMEIKGVTWHNLKIEKKRDFWQATVLFDI